MVYLNHEFAQYLGLDLYFYFTDSAESMNKGLGEWFFRQVAFPEAPDNSAEYINKSYSTVP